MSTPTIHAHPRARHRSLTHRAALALVGAAGLAICSMPALAGFSVSSYKIESRSTGASKFNAAAALDGNPATAWMIDPEQDNVGQWLELEVPMGTVDKVGVIVGWAESDKSWVDHARLAEARIEVYNLGGEGRKLVHEQVATFKDERGMQTIDLPDIKVGDDFAGGAVRIHVTKVFDGKDYAHLALGEVLVYMGEFDAQSIKYDEMGLPSSEMDDHDGSQMLDDNARTFWASDGKPPEGEGVTFTLDGGRYSVSSLGLMPGPKTFARPKTIEVTQANVTRTYTMADTPGKMQWFELPALVGYTGSGIGPVTVKITEVYGTGTGAGVGIAEAKFRATMLEAF